jgi:hypothetical protein
MATSDDVKLAGAATGLKTPDGIVSNIERIGNQNDRIVSQLHGKMYEQSLRLNMFFASNQAAVSTSVALATTQLGFCLSNPAGNTKNIVPRQVCVANETAPVAPAVVGLGGGYAAAGVVTHTTPATTYSCVLGNGQAATGLVDEAATIVGTPLVILPFLGAFTAGAFSSVSPVIVDLEGSIIIPPGGYVFIYTLTALELISAMTWEEIPV